MIATTTVNSPPSSLSSLGHDPVAPSTAPVLRVSREVENIGERVPLSKKRITWRFVFADSAQVHTVTLEHSRISAKKRLRLDGRRLHTSEQYCAGDWRYEFHVAKTHAARFCVAIRDVKSTVVEERSLDSIYQLSVDGRAWDQLDDRALPRPRNGSSVWSSELYARRVTHEERVLERSGDEYNNKAVTAHCVAWTFAFGLHGTIHKLELRDLDRGDDAGEFIVILDSRLLARVNHDDIHEDVWEYEYKLFNQHMLTAIVTLEGDGKKYEFFIDGCAWKDLTETDFVLQPDWFPVYSRTRGTSYFRNQKTAVSQWERPIMSRNGEAIEVPRRLSTQSVPVPTDHFDNDGLVRLSTGQDNQAVEQMAPSLASLTTFHEVPANQKTVTTTKNDDINLIDFSEMAIRVSPTSSHEKETFTSFDPFAHIAVQQQFQAQRRASNQPPVDLLS